MASDSPYDVIYATSPAQMHALSHPSRHKILQAIHPPGATVSQLSNRLSINKGNVAHHLAVLCRAELARKGPARTVRGGTEQYFTRTAHRVMFDPGEDNAATNAALTTISEDLGKTDDHLLNHRTVRLTHAQAEALRHHLDAVVDDLRPADSRESEYGVLVGLYRRR